MGWNSWDCYGTSVTEAEVLANAEFMARRLLPYGWDTVVVDIQWHDPTARAGGYNENAPLSLDGYGRPYPSSERFPSGFSSLAERIHGLGLRFGLHIMRGIPRLAVDRELPVLNTSFTAADVADRSSVCPWNTDNYGLDLGHPGAQAYYDSLGRLFAEWGVDFVKADDMGDHKFQPAEIAALRRALDRTGRPIVLSISPGPARLAEAAFFARHAQLWRISDDFWDDWRLVRKQFDYARDWAPHVGVGGGWPDADMLPFGRLRITDAAGRGTPSRLTPDEQRTVMTLWSVFRSPLIMGGDLPTMDARTRALLTNPEVLAVNQHGRAPRQVLERPGLRVWRSEAPGGADRYVAVFNLDTVPQRVDLAWADVGLPAGAKRVRDLWDRRELGTTNRLRVELAPHASALYRVRR